MDGYYLTWLADLSAENVAMEEEDPAGAALTRIRGLEEALRRIESVCNSVDDGFTAAYYFDKISALANAALRGGEGK